jgi:hypothetical protein
MPIKIELGCDGLFHVSNYDDVVLVKDLDAVHKAIDHHYRDYCKDGHKHFNGQVKGCPLCEAMRRNK